MKQKTALLRWLRRSPLLTLIPLLTAGCDDEFTQEWFASPDTTLLFSLSRPELLGRPSAFDFFAATSGLSGIPVVVETPTATGQWDVALTDQTGGLALVPASAFVGLNSRAGIATMTGTTFDGLREAPGDTARYSRAAVVVQLNTVYVVRTRRDGCGFGSGSRYAKLEAVAIDRTAGTLTFRAITNPICNDRKLIPPD